MTDLARNDDGTFVKGVSGNPAGRPKGAKNHIIELKQALEVAVRQNMSSEDITAIVDSMVKKAKAGNVGAAKLILDKAVSNAKTEEDSAEAFGGFKVVIENATLQVSKPESDNDVIDVTPTPEETE